MTAAYYLIPAVILLALWALYGHREATRIRDVLDDPPGQDQALAADGQPWPAPTGQLDARNERIVPAARPVLTPGEAGLLAGLELSARQYPHPPLVTAMADQIAGLYSARFPAASADQITRMLLASYVTQREAIRDGTSGDLCDATGHAAVVLAHRPDVPEWSSK